MNLCEQEGWICYLCGGEIPRNYILQSPMAPSQDHVIPRWQLKMEPRTQKFLMSGNIRLAHRHCNNEKDNRQPFTLEEAQRKFEEQNRPK